MHRFRAVRACIKIVSCDHASLLNSMDLFLQMDLLFIKQLALGEVADNAYPVILHVVN